MPPSPGMGVRESSGTQWGQGTGTGHGRHQPLLLPCERLGTVCPSRDYVETLMRCWARRRRTMRRAGLLRRCWGELWRQKGLSSSHR